VKQKFAAYHYQTLDRALDRPLVLEKNRSIDTKTGISVNGKILIPLIETKAETKKITKNGNETETETERYFAT